MAKEYKTLEFPDDEYGRKEATKAISFYAKYDWEIKSKETIQQGWSFGKTCCLGVIFLPLALLGRKSNMIHIILEREERPENTKLDAEMDKAEAEQEPESRPMGIGTKVFIGVVIFIGLIGFIAKTIVDTTPKVNIPAQQSSTPSVTQTANRIPYTVLSDGSIDYIILDPKYVNMNDLTALGQELHSDYSSYSFERISIYDNSRALTIRNSVINEQATQADNAFYDLHYVAQYNKNDSTNYNEFAIYQDGSGKLLNKVIDY